ncbi:hypothetical protein EG328_003204 [Venturia inaequalis]|uniref:Glucose-methanol-choline oxidoreductase N-terminal domain-containing protein n=1 Tax=Venturia inaequalis TaxID=5025 RepID=A0A8H3Z0D6_VENIN|nr:hypothetical protein EG328_003204 [Venturia inaequalis]RDI84433.1 hypothetical protein Vi05172_g5561 [Venturia inaequalis]
MGLYTKLPEDLHEVDVVICGGGSAGCVLTSRLAQADPSLSILLIEQGKDNHHVPKVIHPGLFPENLEPDSDSAIFWQGNKSPELAGRAPIVPSGGILGGGSSINWMVFTRGQRSDYDSWNMKGWSAEDVLPFLKKLETYHGQGEKEHHGHEGPIHISKGTFTAKRAEDAFIDTAAALGYREFKDLQNLDNNNGTERWLRYVGPDGLRQDAAHRYLHPLLESGNYPNLHVLVQHKIKRVLFDENLNANGVELHSSTGGLEVKARRLVVLSSGANGTPLILERSGLGAAQVLKRAGVKQLVDLPGVGADYQDHHLSLWTYRTDLTPFETLNGFGKGKFDINNPSKEVKALMGWNSMDASGKFRPTEDEVEALGPDFKAAWDRDFKNAPDRPLMIIAMYNAFLGKKGGIAGNFGDFSTLPDDAEYISCANWTAYPYSRGSIHITGPEATDLPDFNVGYLTDPGDVDLKKHVWAYKISREMFRRMAIYRGELASMHPRFPDGSKAAVQERADGPIPVDSPRIQYSADDDKAIEKAVREVVGTTWHSLGTCKMKARDDKGVVDSSLNVYGVQRLKIADLSVPPENVGANTNNTALMIGEKAADIVVRELGLGNKRKDSGVVKRD